MNRNITLVLVLAVIVLAIIYLESVRAPAVAPQDRETAPELTDIVGYINTDYITIAQNRGKVVLVDFWTYSCINCIRTLPYLVQWDKKYRDMGLVIIGVHTPEFAFEKKYANVLMAVREHGIEYPVVLDNDYATWRAFGNRYWPRKYLIDAEGVIRYDHIGEGAYQETEQWIQKLLREAGKKVDVMVSADTGTESLMLQTPELYAGWQYMIPRQQDLGNEGGLRPKEEFTYPASDSYKEDMIYLEGTWLSAEDHLEAESDGAIILNFLGSEANIVAAPSGNITNMRVFIDGTDQGEVVVGEPNLYNVYEGDYGRMVLRLEVPAGFTFNSFTFG